jgi:hypothetical protein
MRALASTILLLATPALAAPPPAAAGAPPPIASAPAAGTAVVPSAALIEKLGQGDRLFLAADYRNALFAYQDAVYMQPKYAAARVKLGRAYLALRYAPQAIAQAEAALAADPESADARKLLDDAKSGPLAPTGAPAGAVASPAAAAAGAAVATAAPGRPAPRVFRFTPEPDSAPARAAPAPEPAAPPPSASGRESAEEHYRAGVGDLEKRDWAKAVSELSDAIAADPRLAVAYAARGSAYFGLGKYAHATEDYLSATLLDANLATPLYGLAECYRATGDARRAVEMYERYADSRASDVRADLRVTAAQRARELR